MGVRFTYKPALFARGEAQLYALVAMRVGVSWHERVPVLYTHIHTHNSVCNCCIYLNVQNARLSAGAHTDEHSLQPLGWFLQACWRSKHHMCAAKTRAFPGTASDPRRSLFAHTYLRQGLIKTLLVYRPVRAPANPSGAGEHTSSRGRSEPKDSGCI